MFWSCDMCFLPADVTPPIIQCPAEIVMLLYDTEEVFVATNYSTADITATDYSQIDRIEYNPPEGTIVQMMDDITVTATAFDKKGLSASCDFTFEAQRRWIFSDLTF